MGNSGDRGGENGSALRAPWWLQILTLLIGSGVGGFAGVVVTNVVEWRKLEDASEASNLGFVEKYLQDVIKLDIGSRVRIAEYFGQIIEDEGHKKRWNAYLDAIQKKRLGWTDEYVALLSKVENDPDTLTVRERLRLLEMQSYFGEAKDLLIGPSKPEPKPASIASDAGKLLASCAKGQHGITEDPGQQNRGSRVDEYIRAVGGDPAEGKPWGAAFVGWCLKSSGLSDLLPGSVSGVDLWTAAQAKGFAIPAAELFKTSDLQVGDIFVIAEGPVYNVGIVTDVADLPLLFSGIQGDTIQKGGGDGFGVMERRLPLRVINLGIIRLVGATASASQKTTP